jgi:hypothetical protein
MPPRGSTNQPSTETLLREYEASRLTAESMEKTIWQSSAVIGIGLVGSLVAVVLRGEDAQPPWFVGCLVGPLVSILSVMWWFVARRWWSVQHAMFIRMRHIERRLGIHSLNYIQYLDHPESVPGTGLNQAEREDLTARSDARFLKIFKAHQKQGVQEFMWLLPFVMLVAWLAYAVLLLIAGILAAG